MTWRIVLAIFLFLISVCRLYHPGSDKLISEFWMATLKEVLNQMIWTVSLMKLYNQWEQLNLSFYQVL